MLAVTLLKAGEDVYLECGGEGPDKGQVNVFPSVEEGVASHEQRMNRNHARGYEASMSTCLAAIQLQVGVLGVESEKDIEKIVGGSEVKVTYLSGIAVKANGIKLLPEYYSLFDTAAKPRIITEEVSHYSPGPKTYKG